MNYDVTIAPMLRVGLQFLAGLAVAKGLGDADFWVTISGAIVSVGGAWYSWRFVKKAAVNKAIVESK